MVNANNHPRRSKAAATATTTVAVIEHDHELDYSALLIAVEEMFVVNTQDATHLFRTDLGDVRINDLYLDNLPDERQHHDCHTCRRFFEIFGGLVAINADGSTTSILTPTAETPAFYKPSFQAIADYVTSRNVVGLFAWPLSTWGTPVTGEWQHISVNAPVKFWHRGRLLTPDQWTGKIAHNRETIIGALANINVEVLDQALRLFDSASLPRSEKYLAPTRWLRELYDRPRGKLGNHILWRAVAAAPDGFCHPRSSVIGPLLEDIEKGLPTQTIIAKWRILIDPVTHQRAQVPPTAGNIKRGEEIIAKLGVAQSLERRFARLDEIETFWRPPVLSAPQQRDGVFGHLKAKDEVTIKPVTLPTQTMTWVKFTQTVLVNAQKLELHVPSASEQFVAILTAVHADAPPIHKWDKLERRNPVSCYRYLKPNSASLWNLTPGWNEVTALTNLPHLWYDSAMDYLGGGVIAILKGAIDQRAGQGNALFAENLINELFEIRATIEAYSQAAPIFGREEGSACGLGFGNGAINLTFRVFNETWTEYHIDRTD